MKKYIALILGVLFVLGFAASAFATHAEIPADTQAAVAKGGTQITLGGDLRFRGEVNNNTADFNNDGADHSAAYDGRVRLTVNAQVTPNTTGYVAIEATDGPGKTAYTWGNSTVFNKGTGLYQEGDQKRGTLNILEAYILHTGTGLLGVTSGIKVGHMALALGNNLFFDHTIFGDDAILVLAYPTKELLVAAVTAKFREGMKTLNDDSTAYVALFHYTGSGYNLSGDVSYVDDQNVCLGLGVSCHLWNFALRGDTTAGGLGIKADLEVQTGKVDPAGLNFRGYAFLAGLSYKLDNVKLALDFGYGSGDDNATDKKISTFITSLSDTQHTTIVYDYRTVGAAGFKDTGIANTTYARLGASSPLAKDLTGDLNLYLLRSTKKALGLVDIGLGSATTSNDIGTEVDAKINYALDKNLNYYVEGGYLFAGDYWKAVTSGKSPDNAYMIRHGIQLSF